MRFYW